MKLLKNILQIIIDPDLLNNLEMMYYFGLGIEKDLKRASEFNNYISIKNGIGIEKNLQKSLKWKNKLKTSNIYNEN